MERVARNIILKNNSEYGKTIEQAQEAARGGAHLCYDYTTVYSIWRTSLGS